MARGRMISNCICADRKIHELSSDTSRLAFTWLITFADCEGRLTADPSCLCSMLFPRRRDVTIEMMNNYLSEWEALGLIELYDAEGDVWLCLPNFRRHQVGLRAEREADSNIPPPPARSKSGVAPESLQNKPVAGAEPLRSKSGVNPESLRSKSGVSPEPRRSYSGVIEENRIEEKRSRARAREGAADAACCSALLSCFLSLSGKQMASKSDLAAIAELEARPDYNEHRACAALQLCHQAAIERDPARAPRRAAYYVPAIIEALESGTMPACTAGRNNGIAQFKAAGYIEVLWQGRAYWLDDRRYELYNTLPPHLVRVLMTEYEAEHPDRVVARPGGSNA